MTHFQDAHYLHPAQRRYRNYLSNHAALFCAARIAAPMAKQLTSTTTELAPCSCVDGLPGMPHGGCRLADWLRISTLRACASATRQRAGVFHASAFTGVSGVCFSAAPRAFPTVQAGRHQAGAQIMRRCCAALDVVAQNMTDDWIVSRVLGGITGRKKRVTTRTLPKKKAAMARRAAEVETPALSAAMQAAQVRLGQEMHATSWVASHQMHGTSGVASLQMHGTSRVATHQMQGTSLVASHQVQHQL